MKNKTLLILLWISIVFAIIIVAGFYIYHFKSSEISQNPENWGQFGDYIGGLLNPIISIINLIILSYLSIRLVKDEDNRNKWTLKELARPYGELSFLRDRDKIQIIIHNIGLGPMIINYIKIIDKDGSIYNNFEHLKKETNTNISYSFGTMSVADEHHGMAKWEILSILNFSGNTEGVDYSALSRKFRKRLNEHRIELKYSDMYNREIDTIISEVTFKTD